MRGGLLVQPLGPHQVDTINLIDYSRAVCEFAHLLVLLIIKLRVCQFSAILFKRDV